MTVKNLFVLISKEVSTDAVDNMNSIIKIIDKFTFETLPGADKEELKKIGKEKVVIPASYTLATSWLFSKKLDKETLFNFKCVFIDPSGLSLEGPEQENQLPEGIDKFNMNINMQGLPITIAGNYKLKVSLQSLDGKNLAEGEYPYTLDIKKN